MEQFRGSKYCMFSGTDTSFNISSQTADYEELFKSLLVMDISKRLFSV